MQNRWTVLALLFTVRLAMAFQFQAAGAVSPAFMNTYGVALADIGLLISIYLAPGILFAVPGGEIGRRFGDKSVVLFGLALMIAGGLVMAMATSWHGQLAGRLLAGIGGVLINVLMSKMVTDWFAGKEIATAMAIFVNSWPAGIAIALMVLPVVAAAGGVDHAVFIDVEVERVVRLARVVRVAVLRLLPGDDFARVLDEHLALGNVLHREHALAMHARAADLDAAAGGGRAGAGHGKTLLI